MRNKHPVTTSARGGGWPTAERIWKRWPTTWASNSLSWFTPPTATCVARRPTSRRRSRPSWTGWPSSARSTARGRPSPHREPSRPAPPSPSGRRKRPTSTTARERSGEQVGEADEVVGGRDQVADQAGALDPAVAGPAQAADGLDPAEDLLDPFPCALAERVAGPAGGPPVDGAAAFGGVLG